MGRNRDDHHLSRMPTAFLRIPRAEYVSDMLLTPNTPRVPGFTAEAAESTRNPYRGRSFPRSNDPTTIVPQYGWCNCPCCMTVHCGWLGLSTCVECCEAPAVTSR
jgi:hypothetical protein